MKKRLKLTSCVFSHQVIFSQVGISEQLNSPCCYQEVQLTEVDENICRRIWGYKSWKFSFFIHIWISNCRISVPVFIREMETQKISQSRPAVVVFGFSLYFHMPKGFGCFVMGRIRPIWKF